MRIPKDFSADSAALLVIDWSDYDYDYDQRLRSVAGHRSSVDYEHEYEHDGVMSIFE